MSYFNRNFKFFPLSSKFTFIFYSHVLLIWIESHFKSAASLWDVLLAPQVKLTRFVSGHSGLNYTFTANLRQKVDGRVVKHKFVATTSSQRRLSRWFLFMFRGFKFRDIVEDFLTVGFLLVYLDLRNCRWSES